MNKQESQNLMIGSWVWADGKPRQVDSLTTKKAGFKRGTNGHRDFFRFDQIQGIPLSEQLLKECVTYCPTGKNQDADPTISVHCYSDTVIAVSIDGNTKYCRFHYLHEVQSFLLSTYQLKVQFDVEKYDWLRQPEMVVTKDQMDEMVKFLNKIQDSSRTQVCGDIVIPTNKEKTEELIRLYEKKCGAAPYLGKDERGFQYGQLTYKK